MRTVVVIGGNSSVIGPFLVRRLLVQKYAVFILDEPGHTSQCQLGLREAIYTPSLPGDFDFAFRTVFSKKSIFAVVDLRGPLAQVPQLNQGEAAEFLYVLVSWSDEEVEKESNPKLVHRVFVRIPPLVLAPARVGRIPRLFPKVHATVWVGDIARFISDFVFRNPMAYSLGDRPIFLSCPVSENEESIPPDLLHSLPHVRPIDRPPGTSSGLSIFKFELCSIREAVAEARGRVGLSA